MQHANHSMTQLMTAHEAETAIGIGMSASCAVRFVARRLLCVMRQLVDKRVEASDELRGRARGWERIARPAATQRLTDDMKSNASVQNLQKPPLGSINARKLTPID